MATLVVSPQAGSGGGNTTCIGNVLAFAPDFEAGQDFNTLHNAAGSSANVGNGDIIPNLISSNSGVSNTFQTLARGIGTFDTSALTSGAVISSAIMSLRGNFVSENIGNPDLHIAAANPNANNTLVAADFAHVSFTSFGSIAFASWVTNGYNDITLNANGIANISKIGISKFSFQLNWDINNSFTGSWVVGSKSSGLDFKDSQNGSLLPKLTITYTTPGPTDVTNASNATPIVITSGANHGLISGQVVNISVVTGNVCANGNWIIQVLTPTTFALVSSAGCGAWISGGVIAGLNSLSAPLYSRGI